MKLDFGRMWVLLVVFNRLLRSIYRGNGETSHLWPLMAVFKRCNDSIFEPTSSGNRLSLTIIDYFINSVLLTLANNKLLYAIIYYLRIKCYFLKAKGNRLFTPDN